MKLIADRLVAARKKLHLTQRQMARRLRCAQSTVSLIERTGTITRTKHLARWAAAYALPVADLMPPSKAP